MQNKRIRNIHPLLRFIPYRLGVAMFCMFVSVFGIYAYDRPVQNPSDSTVWVDAEEKSLPKSLYASVKTNLLYDALAVPNISAEIYVGKRFSVSAGWMYAWWSRESHHRLWRIYGGEVECRWWFGRKSRLKPLTGHHIGAYLGMLTFNFEFGNKGYLGGLPGGNLWNRAWVNAGVEYGYSLPLSSRLNMDFSIGLGWLGGKLEKYTVEGQSHVWRSTVRQTWIGPTKAEISLVWLLGRENRNLRNH